MAPESWFPGDAIDPHYPLRRSSVLDDVTAATFLDVAVVRCLFMPRWCEEGVHWALQFLFYRFNFFAKYRSINVSLMLHFFFLHFHLVGCRKSAKKCGRAALSANEAVPCRCRKLRSPSVTTATKAAAAAQPRTRRQRQLNIRIHPSSKTAGNQVK